MKDLGEMGESVFRFWCAQSGLICNGSKIDKTGWDFYLEFPFQQNNHSFIPFAMHKSANECKVQVKATDKKNKGSVAISLSNLRRMSTALMPTFLVVIEFDGKASPQRAYLVHVDKVMMAKILKRMLEVDQKDNVTGYNRNTMLISYSDKNIIEPMSGIGLKERLLKCIGADYSEYVIEKNKYLQSVGYEDGAVEMVFSVDGKEGLKALVDASLGLRDSVELKSYSFREKRFGVLRKKSFLSGYSGVFKINDITPVSEGVVIFKEEDTSDDFFFHVKMYVSPFNQGVLDEYKKIKFVASFFEFIIIPCVLNVTYSFSIDHEIRLNVKKFKDVIDLMYLINSSGKKLNCRLVFDDFPIINIGLNCNSDFFNYSDIREILGYVIKIMDGFGFVDVLDMSFQEIVSQRVGIKEFYMVLNSSAELFRAEFDVDMTGDSRSVLGDAGYIVMVSYLIGLYRFSVIFVLVGSLEFVGVGRYRLIGKEKYVEKRFVNKIDEELSSDLIKNDFERIERKYGEKYMLISDIKINRD
jgi:hypothetical protein